jgi:hypothetical protein
VRSGSLLSSILVCYHAFPSNGRRKKDDLNHDNSKRGAGKLGYLYEVMTVVKASVVLIVTVLHFSGVSIPDANKQLKERAISVIAQGR